MLRTYYHLAKPGIVYGNILAAIAGFFLASHGVIDLSLLIAVVIGLSLVIASAAVFNNILDRDIDAMMERTKHRALASGAVRPASAFIYACALGVTGFWILIVNANHIAFLGAFFGFVVYVFAYTFLKRRTIYAMHIGALAGATPPFIGYTAVSAAVDGTAVALFCALLLWQMVHFLSISIRRHDEYTNAGIPLRPTLSGVAMTKRIIMLYCIAFPFAALVPVVLGTAGYVYGTGIAFVSLIWISIALAGLRAKDDVKWAHRMFAWSLAVLTAFSLLLIIGL